MDFGRQFRNPRGGGSGVDGESRSRDRGEERVYRSKSQRELDDNCDIREEIDIVDPAAGSLNSGACAIDADEPITTGDGFEPDPGCVHGHSDLAMNI